MEAERVGEVILHGDCLELMPDIPDKSVDMILCDLPYGTTACKWDTVIPFETLWEQYNRIIKDNGVIVLTGSEPFSSALRMSNLKNYKYEWVWNKIAGSNFMNLSNRPFKTHENILVFSNTPNFTFNPIRIKRSDKSLLRDKAGKKAIIKRAGHIIEHYNCKASNEGYLDADGKKHPVDIITFSKDERGRYKFKHPTKKPVALFEYLIKTYTNEGDLVLDNCAGSGTTGVACERTNRKYILMEKEAKYIEVINFRISKEKEQVKLAI